MVAAQGRPARAVLAGDAPDGLVQRPVPPAVVRQTVSLKETGVDGVFYDNVRNEPQAWVPFLKAVREAVGDDFLILANAGYAVGEYDFAAPYLNGMMYESGWSHNRTQWDDCIAKMQHTQSLLRQPTISLIERFEEIRSRGGWPGDSQARPRSRPPTRRAGGGVCATR